MQNLQETHDQEFQEVKKIAAEISQCATPEDYTALLGQIRDFADKVTALKIYQSLLQQPSLLEESESLTERKVIDFEIDTKFIESISTPEMPQETTPEETVLEEEYFVERDRQQQELRETIATETERELEEKEQLKQQLEAQREQQRLQEERRKIVEIEKPSKATEPVPPAAEKPQPEKKFKLAPIKGLKTTVKSLFDDDPLEQFTEEKKDEPAPQKVTSEISAAYLEAPKKLPDFKLDINDRLAFTKMLFGGSQVELNQMISRLNSYATLEDARQYLSDVYYERNWAQADEYAQRLWSLVESKFL